MEMLLKLRVPFLRILTIFSLRFVQISCLKCLKQVVNSFFIYPKEDLEIEKLINLNQNESLDPCIIPVKILKTHVDF